jgi:hypothetical protein
MIKLILAAILTGGLIAYFIMYFYLMAICPLY